MWTLPGGPASQLIRLINGKDNGGAGNLFTGCNAEAVTYTVSSPAYKATETNYQGLDTVWVLQKHIYTRRGIKIAFTGMPSINIDDGLLANEC
jgi:hypothetical protein